MNQFSESVVFKETLESLVLNKKALSRCNGPRTSIGCQPVHFTGVELEGCCKTSTTSSSFQRGHAVSSPFLRELALRDLRVFYSQGKDDRVFLDQ